MKKLLVACSLASMISLAHAAEPAKPASTTTDMPPQHHMMKGHHMQKSPTERAAFMKEKLGLTAEQTAKMQKIFEQRDQQRTALREKYKPQLDAYYADKKNLHEKTHGEVKALLTPDQQEKLNAMHEGKQCDHGKQGGMHEGMKNHGGAMKQ